MKRIISITIALCLVFCSILPVYAEAWSSSQASQIVDDVRSIKTYIQSFVSSWTTFFETGQGTISTLLTFQDLMRDIVAMGDWLAPMFEYAGGLRPESMMSIWDTLTTTLSAIVTSQSILSTLSSNINTSNNSYLNYIRMGVGYSNINDNDSTGLTTLQHVSHMDLNTDTQDSTRIWGSYPIYDIGSNGTFSVRKVQWPRGTGIGNLALILQQINYNFAKHYANTWSAALNNYNDNLSTWEHSTNTQTSFTPTSLVNGLYRFLAYIQSDTSSLYYGALKDVYSPFTYYNNNNLVSVTPTSFSDAIYKQWSISDSRLHSVRGNASSLGTVYFRNPIDLTQSSYNYKSTDDLLRNSIYNISNSLARLAYVLANDEEIAARLAAKDDQNAVVNNFVASSGNASASPTDYATVSAASFDFQNNFNTGVSASGVWTAFSNNYEWFTQTTADNLDTSQNNTRSACYETPYLDNYYLEVMGFFENKRSDIKESPDFVSNYIEQFNAQREVPIEEEQR